LDIGAVLVTAHAEVKLDKLAARQPDLGGRGVADQGVGAGIDGRTTGFVPSGRHPRYGKLLVPGVGDVDLRQSRAQHVKGALEDAKRGLHGAPNAGNLDGRLAAAKRADDLFRRSRRFADEGQPKVYAGLLQDAKGLGDLLVDK
jgi:hypothetical protein